METDPLRPSDHVDGDDTITQPRLGFVGWLRWGWRQLTSMRTALILLLVLAIAAIPGSIFPQRMADPNGVTQWERDNPDLFPVLDALKMFDVYLSPWFSAIYLLLFTSLVGCVIPRIKHHAKALQARPPRTPARLKRLADFRAVERKSTDAAADAAATIDVAQKQLKALGYRVERYDSGRTFSVSAERGYWRETGNLVFHIALVGVLITVGVGGGFAYTGQRVLVEGETFANTLLDYDSMNRGRFVGDGALTPYSMRLDTFDANRDVREATARMHATWSQISVAKAHYEYKKKAHDLGALSDLDLNVAFGEVKRLRAQREIDLVTLQGARDRRAEPSTYLPNLRRWF